MAEAILNLDKELLKAFVKNEICRYDKKGILDIELSYCRSCSKMPCYSHRIIKTLLYNLFDSFKQESIVAIRGAGKQTDVLLKFLKDRKAIVDYIIDINSELKEFAGIPVLHLDGLAERKIDHIVISPNAFRYEMKEELHSMGYDKNRVIDLCEYLAENGFHVDNSFFSFLQASCFMRDRSDHMSVWYGVSIARSIYHDVQHTGNIEIIQDYLYELILSYLSVRDFVNARKYSHIYIQSKYKDYKMLQSLLADLDILFERIRTVLLGNIYEDIIVFHFDALENDMIEHMEYMKSIKNNSITFSNAFTQYYHTTSTWQIMYTGRDLIDEKAFEVTELNHDNSRLLRTLKEHGYKFCMLPGGKNWPLFNKENSVQNDAEICTISETLWQLLQLLVCNEKALYYTHILETHTPFQCGFSDVCYERFEIQKLSENEQAALLLKSLKYVDEQFEFYNSLIPDEKSKIIMSDHGVRKLYKLDGYNINDCVTNDQEMYIGFKTVLLYCDKKCHGRDINAVFSLNNFTELILHLMGLADVTVLYQEYSKIQMLPIYDWSLIDSYVKNNWSLPLPAKGIATANEKYLIDYNGKETYQTFLSDDFRKNRIDEPEFQSRINELRELCGSDFHGIFEHPKFAYAKKIYKEKGLI